VIGIDPLGAETVALVGYQGGEITAFGRSLSLSVSEDELSTSLLLLRTDDFAWLETPSRRAFSAAVATGDGEFWVTAGLSGTDAFDGTGTNTRDDWWTLSVTEGTELTMTEVPGLVVPSLMDEPDNTAAMTDGRQNHTMTLLNDGTVLLTGGGQGLLSAQASSSGAYLWRPGETEMSEADTMKRGRNFHETILLPSGDVVVIGGMSLTGQANSFSFNMDYEHYDITDGEFKQPQRLISVGGYGNAGVALRENGALVCGGMDNNSKGFIISAGCDLNGLDRTIAAETPLPVGVVYHEMTALTSGQVLLTGGLTSPAGSEVLNDRSLRQASEAVYLFEGGSWIEVAPMNHPRAMHSAAVLPDGRVLVVGGAINFKGVAYLEEATALPCAEIYEPATDTWTEVDPGCSEDSAAGSIPAGAWGMSMAVDDDYGVLFVGGVDFSSPVEGAALFVGMPNL
jgi:hypothetical protein